MNLLFTQLLKYTNTVAIQTHSLETGRQCTADTTSYLRFLHGATGTRYWARTVTSTLRRRNPARLRLEPGRRAASHKRSGATSGPRVFTKPACATSGHSRNVSPGRGRPPSGRRPATKKISNLALTHPNLPLYFDTQLPPAQGPALQNAYTVTSLGFRKHPWAQPASQPAGRVNNCVPGRQPVTVSGYLWGGEGRTQVHTFRVLESKGNIVHRDGVQEKCPRTQTALRIGGGSTRPLATGQLLRSERREGILGTSGHSSVEPGAAPAHGDRLPSGGTRRHARCFTSDQETRAQQKVTERRPYFLGVKVLGQVGRVTCSLAPRGGSF